MRRMAPSLLAFALSVLSVFPAMALDPATKQQVCNDLQQTAANALETGIKVYVPKQNPSRTFNDATQVCLKLIVQYNKIPMGMLNLAALQPILKQLGEDLITKECSAAAASFNRTLNDALSEQGLSYRNGSLNYSGTIDGVPIGGSTRNGGSITVDGNTTGLNAGGQSTSGSGGVVNWGDCTGQNCK